MSETPLKIVPAPEAKTSPAADAPATEKSGRFAQFGRKNLRMILLVGLPAIAALIGLALYLSGGRYISTDNAYVGAQKVLITPDISDKIVHVAVVEGQHVKPGDELFTLDPVPYRLALDQAQAKLAVAMVTLVPVRFILAMTILLLYYLVCRVFTLFSSPHREEEEEEEVVQEDYAHMGGWRRSVIVGCGRFLSRVLLFVFGFYWIPESYPDPETTCSEV